MTVLLEKLLAFRKSLECAATSTAFVLFLTAMLILLIAHLATGQTPPHASAMHLGFNPLNAVMHVFAGGLFVLMLLPEAFLFFKEEKSVANFFTRVLKSLYWVVIWLVWSVLIYALALFLWGSVVWSISIL